MTRALTLALIAASLIAPCLIAGVASAETLTVSIDKSTRLNVAGSVASVVVGNPQVADVTVVDSHTIFISGRGYGSTDVVLLDGAGRTVFSGDILVSGGNAGRVSVYRGAERTDMACAPGCEVSFRSPTKGGSSGSAGGATAAAAGGNSGGGGLSQMLGGAMSAAAGTVGHAMTPQAQ